MADYISRDKAVAIFEALKNGTLEDGNRMAAAVWKLSAGIVSRLPAADVAPVRHGRWEGYTHSRYCGMDEYGDPVYRDGVVFYCSNPKCMRKTVVKENYCPNCGAKMDGGENNDD